MTEIAHQDLLTHVAERLYQTPSNTDHLMLIKWRVLTMCQYVLGGNAKELEDACVTALEVFAANGPGASCDDALVVAGAVIKRMDGLSETILPSISRQKHIAVSQCLDTFAKGGPAIIDEALRVLPTVRERMRSAGLVVLLPGIRHRFELIAVVLQDTSRQESDRVRAAAAVIYVDKIRDVFTDTLGIIGMADDDYALRVVLEELGSRASCVHWSEKISSLWEDLPFLQGVNLQRGNTPISVTWLDRVNSYIAYSHVMGFDNAALILLQPSIECSPLHTIVSLIGLLILDAVTSSESKAHALTQGQTYEVDDFRVRFEGTAGPPTTGWLRLRLRDGFTYEPPGLADRMVPVNERRLSSLREFAARLRGVEVDPMQRFFNWETAIGPASITNRLVLVASRQRALELMKAVESNGVYLLDTGLCALSARSQTRLRLTALLLWSPRHSAQRVFS